MSPPTEVQDIHKMDYINCQFQFGRTFLLQDSPGEVSKKLNDFVNLSIIDDIFYKINSLIYETNRDIKIVSSEIDEIKIELSGYNYLDDLKLAIDRVNKDIVTFSDLASKTETLSWLINEIKSCSRKILKLEKLSKYDSELNEIVKLAEKHDEITNEFNGLINLVSSIKELDRKISELGEIDIDKINKIEECVNELSRLTQMCDDLGFLIEKIYSLEEELNFLRKELRERIDVYAETLKQLKICPLCGQKIDDEVLEKHLRGLEK